MFQALDAATAPGATVESFDPASLLSSRTALMGCGRTPRRESGSSSIRATLPPQPEDVPRRVRGAIKSRHHRLRGLRQGEFRRLVDEQADAGRPRRPTSRRASSTAAGARRWARPWGCVPRFVRTGARCRSTTSTAARRVASVSFTMHVLLGDVLLVQPDAYSQVAHRTAVVSRWTAKFSPAGNSVRPMTGARSPALSCATGLRRGGPARDVPAGRVRSATHSPARARP